MAAARKKSETPSEQPVLTVEYLMKQLSMVAPNTIVDPPIEINWLMHKGTLSITPVQ